MFSGKFHLKLAVALQLRKKQLSNQKIIKTTPQEGIGAMVALLLAVISLKLVLDTNFDHTC